MAASGAAFAREQIDSVRTSATQVVGAARHRYRKVIRDHRDVAMIPGSIDIDGLRLNSAVSDNDGGAEQITAINIHGYFAGGEMASTWPKAWAGESSTRAFLASAGATLSHGARSRWSRWPIGSRP